MATDTLQNKRIAILEDNPTNRERWTSLVALCGGKAVPVDPPAPKLRDLKKFLTDGNISLVMCDNRLFEQGNYADYCGAEAVAESYRNGFGGVLVTAYENDDAELSIREHRRWIASLVHATQLKKQALSEALLVADREVRKHDPARDRVPHRSVMTVRNIFKINGRDIVKVMLAQWNAKSEVGFPLDMVPKDMRKKVEVGKLLIAQVNIEAARSEDLFFDKFELPDPNVYKKAEKLFSRP